MLITYNENLSIENEFISISKPKIVFDRIKTDKDIILDIEPFSNSDFYDCHNQRYVDGVFNSTRVNGFGNSNEKVSNQIRYTSAALYTAGLTAVITSDCRNPTVVFAPVSGFHHAHYNFGKGFCTFNGLVLTALKLKRRKLLTKIAILDLDGHYGDGTEDIINKLCIWDWLHNYTHNKNIDKIEHHTLRFLETFVYSDYDLIIYQAGADASINDPLGAGYLSDRGIELRDEIVFSKCKEHKTPIIFNLAGGYNNEKTIDLHANTVNIARKIYE